MADHIAISWPSGQISATPRSVRARMASQATAAFPCRRDDDTFSLTSASTGNTRFSGDSSTSMEGGQ